MSDSGPTDKPQNGLDYRRVLLKLSGEALLGAKQFGIDQNVLTAFAEEIGSVVELGVEVAVVIGRRDARRWSCGGA